MLYPGVSAAAAETSGMPLCLAELNCDRSRVDKNRWTVLCCQSGAPNTVLYPPPLAPPFVLPSFHATSDTIRPLVTVIRVPPTAVTHGLEAGKSTARRPERPSVTPFSPDATRTVMPCVEANSRLRFSAAIACLVQLC